jgi:hypothetical protein
VDGAGRKVRGRRREALHLDRGTIDPRPSHHPTDRTNSHLSRGPAPR